MKKIIIFGAGGFGREVVELISQINSKQLTWEILGYIDDGIEIGKEFNGYKVLGGLAYLNENISEDTALVLAIGNPKTKEKIISKINNANIYYPVLIHPNVVMPSIDKDISIGEGSIICAFTFISLNVVIGKHVLINVNCTVGHDAVIGNYSCLMPNVNVSGEVILGDRTYGGVGAKIINQVNVVPDVTIGAGSVVIKSIEVSGTVMGVPARMIIKN
jgi:sugar O-acyltransferase (sialic acid O-acetyltransferase NeuD family)